MTSTDIAVYENGHSPASRDVVDGWVAMLGPVAEYANQISRTEFVPKALYGKPAAITACILTGREMGLGPMLSLKVIHMVEGRPTLSAEYKRARALEAGHEITYDETSVTRCVVRGRRRGSQEWTPVTWSMDDARRAKLDGRPNYRLHPRRQLEARATGELCDLLFADCTYGLATLEAVQDGDYEIEAPEADTPAAPEPKPAPRTAQRKQRAPKTPAAAAPDEKAPAAAGPALPGEEEPDDGVSDRLRKLRGIIHQHFKRLEFDEDEEREQRLQATAVLAGLDQIGSTNDLTEEQASVVADALAKCRDRERLIALLVKTEEARDA
jgi:hypothetical protein